VISALVAAFVPTPFMLLELLVGVIQASVFAMLTLVYMTVATSAPHGEEEHH
jgi:F-type H+-transporting ATPase subunit a